MIAAALLLLASATVPAQEVTSGCKEVTFSRFGQNLRRNFWQDIHNPAGIRQDTAVARIAYAELYGKMNAGGFRQSYEASLPWAAGADARALVHLNRFSMQGSFAFEQSMGSDMCGSMFAEPGRYPIDALEFTPGRKVRQTYSFDGSISVDVADRWRVGAGLDFKAINLSKRKDLRHSNYVLDMTLAPGVIWHKGGTSAGFNAIIVKSSDCPKAEQVGSKDTYDAFLNKGLWYGKLEGWEGSGLHLDEAGVTGLPVKKISFGAGAGLETKFRGRTIFLGLDYRHGRGTIGEKQYIWYRFPSHELSAIVGLRLEQGAYTHSIRGRFEYSRLVNSESILEKVTEGGVSTTLFHGSNAILWRNTSEVCAEYSFVRNCDEFTALLSSGDVVSTAAQMYPFASCEKYATLTFSAGYLRHVGPLDLAARVLVHGGRIAENEYWADENSGVQTSPYRLEEYWILDREYRTATRAGAGIGVTWHFWKELCLRAEADYTRAFGIRVLPGADRACVMIGLGYEF